MEQGILLLIATGLSWVIIGIVISRSSAKGWNLDRIQAGAALLILLGSFILFPFLAGAEAVPPSPSVVISLLFAGIANYMAFLMMNRAMKSGHNGIVWSLVQSALIWPFLMGILFFGVECTLSRICGVLLILAGILVAGLVRNGSVGGWKEWLPAALAAFALAGLSQCLANLPSYLGGGEFSSVAKAAALQLGTLVAFGVLLCLRRTRPKEKTAWMPILALAGATVIPQYFLFYRGLDLLAAQGAGAIGYPIVLGSCIAGFSLYSAFILHERVTAASAGSIFFCLVGIVIIAC